MTYGLPYKGSKNKLAERIVRLLPRKRNLVDLFCGGCAVSHAALVMGKYEHIHINDINWMVPTLFIDALNGKYNNETRWISRDDFLRLRTTDPYVAVVWSFGNNLRDYLYSQKREPLKKAIHYAIFFSDYSLAKELGHDISFIGPIGDVQKRYISVKRYFSQLGLFGGRAEWLSRRGDGKLELRNESLENIERLVRLQAVKSELSHGSEHQLPITSSVLDYAEVEIPADSVIYCDIPYEGTNVYNGAKHFDYERFYQWTERQTEPVFISSYNMPPDRFDCIQEWSHRSTISSTKNKAVMERIFVPRHQAVCV